MQVPVAPKYSVDRQNTYVSYHPKAFRCARGSQRRCARGVVGLGNQLKGMSIGRNHSTLLVRWSHNGVEAMIMNPSPRRIRVSVCERLECVTSFSD